MEISVIVAVYNRYKHLYWCLKSLINQTVKDFEIIIADDGSNGKNLEKIKEIIECFSKKCKIKHIWHEDLGNRKTLILNKAVKSSEGELLIFLDCDVIAEKKLIEKYLSYYNKFREKYELFFFTGNVIFVKKRISDIILENPNLKYDFVLKFIKKNYPFSQKLQNYYFYLKYAVQDFFKTKYPKGWGANLFIPKKTFYSVNGFNNDWTGRNEDSDLMRRMVLKGAKRISLNNKIKVFHLEHGRVWEPEKIRKEKRRKLKWEYYKKHPEIIVAKNGVNEVEI